MVMPACGTFDYVAIIPALDGIGPVECDAEQRLPEELQLPVE